MKFFGISIFAAVVMICADEPLFHSRTPGTRARAMGGAYTAIAGDYSAFWYNPSGLAYIPYSEINASLQAEQFVKETTFDGGIFESHGSAMGLGGLGYVRSFPVRRGGLAYSISFSSPYTLGDSYVGRGYDEYRGSRTRLSDYELEDSLLQRGDSVYFDTIDFFGYGNLYYLSGALGWQFAEGLAFGASLSLVTGGEDQSLKNAFNKKGQPLRFENSLTEWERSFLGYDARLGLMMSPESEFSLGVSLVMPQIIHMEETYRYFVYDYDRWSRKIFDFSTARLYRPLRIQGGIAYFLPDFTISVQGEASAPLSTVRSGEAGSYWKGLAAVGLEWRVLDHLSLRTGYTYREADMHNYKISYDTGADSRFDTFGNVGAIHSLSGGFGYGFSEQMILEAAVLYDFPREYTVGYDSWKNSMDENVNILQGELNFRFIF
jgi:hypothetical protein